MSSRGETNDLNRSEAYGMFADDDITAVLEGFRPKPGAAFNARMDDMPWQVEARKNRNLKQAGRRYIRTYGGSMLAGLIVCIWVLMALPVLSYDSNVVFIPNKALLVESAPQPTPSIGIAKSVLGLEIDPHYSAIAIAKAGSGKCSQAGCTIPLPY